MSSLKRFNDFDTFVYLVLMIVYLISFFNYQYKQVEANIEFIELSIPIYEKFNISGVGFNTSYCNPEPKKFENLGIEMSEKVSKYKDDLIIYNKKFPVINFWLYFGLLPLCFLIYSVYCFVNGLYPSISLAKANIITTIRGYNDSFRIKKDLNTSSISE